MFLFTNVEIYFSHLEFTPLFLSSEVSDWFSYTVGFCKQIFILDRQVLCKPRPWGGSRGTIKNKATLPGSQALWGGELHMSNDTVDVKPLLMPVEIAEKIKAMLGGFTPRQRGLAEFILQNPESIMFFSITDLAKRSGVSQATITRFCNVIGYEGFLHFSREMQQSIQAELGTVGRFNLARSLKGKLQNGQSPTLFEKIVDGEIDNLLNLAKSIKTYDFYRCVDMMSEAHRICIVGCMASACLASFFGYMLGKIFPQVDILTGHGAGAFAISSSLDGESLVFLISFPRYPRATVELGRLAAQKGAKVIAITNSHVSPVVPLAELSFIVPVGIVSFVDAYAGPVVLMNALVTELSERNPERTHQALIQFDTYAEQTGIFVRSRIKSEESRDSKVTQGSKNGSPSDKSRNSESHGDMQPVQDGPVDKVATIE